MKNVFRFGAAFCVFPSAAVAADLPSYKSPPVFVATGTNWDGFYIGLNWGVAKGQKNWSTPTGAGLLALNPRFPADGAQNGIFGGATIGWNHQMGPWVLGVEADIAAASLYGSAVCGGVFGYTSIGWECKTRTDTLGSLTGRLGYATGRALFYGKAGFAYARDSFEITSVSLPSPPVARVSVSQSRTGWTLGAGLEYALGTNWSAKAEYDYYNLGRRAFSGFDPAYLTSYGASVVQTEHLVKFGLNYRFGGGSDVSSPAPAIANDLSGEFGTRVGYTTGRFQWDLKAPGNAAQLNSRLIWSGQAGLALEGFARIDHTSGVFAKGFIGGFGLFGSSRMHDEDFPPEIAPYSNTVSTTKNGIGLYGTIDLGYTLFRGAGWKLGGFIGYNHFEEQMHAYGCTQIATGNICQPAGSIPSNDKMLSRSENWNSMRVGFNAEVMATDRLKLSVDAAWLPTVNFRGKDNHWLRPDINPLSDSGHGNNGYQLEGIASYRVTDRLSLGAGARYWSLNAKGNTQFPGAPAPSPTIYKSTRTTVFLQASYAFGGDAAFAFRSSEK